MVVGRSALSGFRFLTLMMTPVMDVQLTLSASDKECVLRVERITINQSRVHYGPNVRQREKNEQRADAFTNCFGTEGGSLPPLPPSFSSNRNECHVRVKGV